MILYVYSDERLRWCQHCTTKLNRLNDTFLAPDEIVDLERTPAVKLILFFQVLRDRAMYFTKARSVLLHTKKTEAVGYC